MPTPFPGMDPYLERRGLWEEIHTNLIIAIQHFLAPLLRPKYRVAVEQRTYLSVISSQGSLIGLPDVMITTTPHTAPLQALAVADTVVADPPEIGELPMPEEIKERYLEIRDTATHQVVTAIEILSPTNKETKEGRLQYEEKRTKLLASATSLVEIDLLRAGQPFAMKISGANKERTSDYRIVISRSWQRPRADLYLFGVRQPIPSFHVPLRFGEQEPVLPLNRLLHTLYDQVGYDITIDYTQPADPPLAADDAKWTKGLLPIA